MSMIRVVCVVQARMASSRLPGKAMEVLGRRPIVEQVLRRVRRSQRLSEIILATTNRKEDEVLSSVAGCLGIDVFRGSCNDVLGRMLSAAEDRDTQVVVRVCADNPLVAPEEIDRIVNHHLKSRPDYSFNHRPAMRNQYPNGLGAEVLEFEVLESLAKRASATWHREHVTSYIWEHPGSFRIETVQAPDSIAGPDIRLDVDTRGDLERLRTLVQHASVGLEFWSAASIVETYRRVFPSQPGSCSL